ncbi:type III-B CRISPR module RAMP protein Cmr1 [Cohnella faecalis]|uniref:type III-B CRISPR module RAMP protein Cmr1 n=1 Tax=Cohnella faecalis TaxID=2315694 RepID=UPI0013140925|nr:type III-B CRISPR module RAMP protein Cmr1 [Cohnella faecalis]
MNVEAPDLQKVEQWIESAGKNLFEQYPITVVTSAIIGKDLQDHMNGGEPRISSIRGHLRFWWRATRGAKYKDAHDLKVWERQIFGDTSLPSPCKLKLTSVVKNGRKEYSSIPTYVSFPYRDQKKKNKDKNKEEMQFKVFEAAQKNRGLSFILQIDYLDSLEYLQGQEKPHRWLTAIEVKNEVEAALWAWINFGGIGARTRRGCGSLYSAFFSPQAATSEELEGWIKQCVAEYRLPVLNANEHREWPILALLTEQQNSIAVQEQPDAVMKAWEETVRVYSKFRQKRNWKKDINRKPQPGRSHWPEPDSLRRITGQSTQLHKSPVSLNPKDDIAFPRAQFGMPIIFRFKDNIDGKGDPPETELVPLNKKRLASPLILKSLAVSEDKAFGAMICLVQPPLERLQLSSSDASPEVKEKVENQTINKKQIYPEKIENSLYPLRNSVPNAVEGFLRSEVVRQWKKMQPSRR